MIFLIHYDRRAQRLERLAKYADEALHQAQEDRLALELSLIHSDRENEIVLLSAPTEADIRKTHSRYFYKFEEIARQNGYVLSTVQC